MTEIYWIQVIGNLGDLSGVALAVMIIALVILTFGYFTFEEYDKGLAKE